MICDDMRMYVSISMCTCETNLKYRLFMCLLNEHAFSKHELISARIDLRLPGLDVPWKTTCPCLGYSKPMKPWLCLQLRWIKIKNQSVYSIYIYMWILYDYMKMFEGSLEVKLPTIWTDEKQRWKGSERRDRLEERRVEEKESEERRCRCAKR